MKRINVLITTPSIADSVEKYLEARDINCFVMQNCKGISSHSTWLDYLNFAEDHFVTLFFKTEINETHAIERFILANFNEKNNGIMFTLKGDDDMQENVLYVAIVNVGFGEKVADIVRKVAKVGATVVEARGTGTKQNELFGMPIDSGKELIMSVMPGVNAPNVKKQIKKDFIDSNTDVVAFILPVADFTKMHN